MCGFFSKDFALQACNRFSWRSRHVSLVRRSNGQNAKAPTIQYWVFQEDQGITQSRNGHLAPTSQRRSSTTSRRRRSRTDLPIMRQRRLGSGESLGKPIPRGLAAGGRLGSIGRFKGAGSLLGQAGGRSSTTADLLAYLITLLPLIDGLRFRSSSQRTPPVTPQCGKEPRIPPLRTVVADGDAQRASM